MYINNINSNVAPWQLRDTYFDDLENSAHYTAFFASVTGTAIYTHPADSVQWTRRFNGESPSGSLMAASLRCCRKTAL